MIEANNILKQDKGYQYLYDPTIPADLLLGGFFGAFLGAGSEMLVGNGYVDEGLLSGLTNIANNGLDYDGVPRAYINYILFDKNYQTCLPNGMMIEGKKLQISQTGKFEIGDTDLGLHEQLQIDPITISKEGFVYIYLSNQTPGSDVYFDDLMITHTQSSVIQKDDYYPFGLSIAGLNSSRENALVNNFIYNGKELQTGLGLDWYDYGARMYDAALGRWHVQDGKAEFYFATTPYAYALNQPTNAIDPDGNLVIFINGNHFGSGGKSNYWRAFEKVRIGSLGVQRSYYYQNRQVGQGFDQAVMKQLNDQNALYVDGALGGRAPLNLLANSANVRESMGAIDGAQNAAKIIENLAKDKSGNIAEIIKIITHSMGGAYGKGYVRALMSYIRNSKDPQIRKVKISLVADFDPYQGGGLTANDDIFTQQFWHDGGFFGLADEIQKGADDVREDENESSHSVTTFFSSLRFLQVGTYEWNKDTEEWYCTSCKD